MTSSTIHVSLILSLRTFLRAADRGTVRTGALALLLLFAIGAARAHEADPAAIPESGVRASGAIAAAAAIARDRLQGAVLPGVLGTGQSLRDRRGLRLEHAVVDIAGRSSWGLGGQLAIGLHDRDKPHIESAWLDMPLGGDLHLGGGRGTVPTTPGVAQAGHFDRFALMPLAKRALSEGHWTEDGLTLAWRPSSARGAGPDRVVAGGWRGRAFPSGGMRGARTADRPISLSVGWDVGDAWQIDAFAAHMRPVGRGSLVRSSTSDHTHGSPVCDTSLADRVCFDGRDLLWGAGIRWRPLPVWTVSANVLTRDERGQLYSANGNTAYSGRTAGGWLDVVWRTQDDWEIAGRLERLQAHHALTGPGAALVASDAGLLDNRPKHRASFSASWLGAERWRVSIECGDDRSLGTRNPYVMLRAVWQFGRGFLGR